GVPVQVALGYPSAGGADERADPDLRPGYGHWRAGYTPEAQAEWAAGFGALALCKPFVTGVHWCHLGDDRPHLLPHCGLLDAAGDPKPAFARWRDLREACVS
ncbi:MAG: glycoside hydrolase, partial [Catenulispora sp.]